MAELGYYVVPSKEANGQPYILINDIFVDHYQQPRTHARTKKSPHRETLQYFKGTLLKKVEVANDPMPRDKVLCKHPDSDVYFQCSKKDLKEISEHVYELLLAISNCRDRLEVFHKENRLADGLEMDVGTEVSVKIPNHSDEVQGVIRHKGEVAGKDGIQFGVELYNADGRGNCNGSHGKARYFKCENDTGIFLPLSRVRPMRNRNQSPVSAPRRSKQSRLSSAASSNRSRSGGETCPLTHGITKGELATLGITHGMEVYIFTEVKGRESQEKGRVKFIGRLPGSNSNTGIYVGIDLDEAVGNGTGLYNGKHLFYTKQNHAALVPLSGVLPAYVAEVETLPGANIHQDPGMASNFPNDTTVKKPHQLYNSSPITGYRRSDVLSHSQKTFVQQQSNRAHSSPGVLGRSDGPNRVEEYPVQETGKTYYRRSPRRSPCNSPMELKDTENSLRDHVENALLHQNQKPVVEGRRPIRASDSDDNSGDETDLYGSDDSITMKKVLERRQEDMLLQRQTRSSSPTMHHLYRPRDVSSMPGFGAPNLMTVQNARSSKTVPGYHRINGHLAELVDFKSIENELTNGTRQDDHELEQMEVGSMVEVADEALGQYAEPGPTYGVIKWIGTLPENVKEPTVGVELERAIAEGNDGTFNGVRYFSCDFGRGHFVFLKFCKRDPRFLTPEPGTSASMAFLSMPRDFGSFDSPQIPGAVPPPKKLVQDMTGKKRGIQGHHNSCYLDSTLFSLFAYSQVLDTILFRPRKADDLPEYEETQTVLKELIINPLRKHHFVRADRIMRLRELLDKLGSTTGLVNEEKDPEEFLNTLLNQVFKAEPLHELRQGDSNAAHEGYFYQIFMEKDEKIGCPSTQQLLEKSLIAADLKFRNVPVCLIVQMPRFGKDYKMYKKLKPSLELEITNLVEDMPRSCDICEGFAEYECRDCFLEGSLNEFVFSYCKDCAYRIHSHRKRKSHRYKAIKVPDDFREYAYDASKNEKELIIQRQTLELFAVVCIATSHYVSFAKCGSGKNSSWVFFDSMADRVGEQNGYNIPEVTPCPEFEKWLSLDERSVLLEDEKLMPELKRRLLCDSYMCMYQSTELMFNK